MLSDGSIVEGNQDEIEQKNEQSNKFNDDAYKETTYDEFMQFISEHFNDKKAINFKGMSYFNSSNHKFKITIPYKPVPVPSELGSTLAVVGSVMGNKEIPKVFTHYFKTKQQEIDVYFFIQNALVTPILQNWENTKKYELYVAMPYTDHYNNYVPLLVNATNALN